MFDWVGQHDTGVIRTPLPPNIKNTLDTHQGYFFMSGVLSHIRIYIKYWKWSNELRRYEERLEHAYYPSRRFKLIAMLLRGGNRP